MILSPSGRTILARSEGYSSPPEFAGLLDLAWSNALADPGVLAMGGYCPVRLVQGKGRVAGDPRLAVFHDGHAYRFADAAARDLFLKDPEQYLPSNGGLCAVSLKDSSKDGPRRPLLRRDLPRPPLPVLLRLGPPQIRRVARRLQPPRHRRQRPLPPLQVPVPQGHPRQARVRLHPLRQAILLPRRRPPPGLPLRPRSLPPLSRSAVNDRGPRPEFRPPAGEKSARFGLSLLWGLSKVNLPRRKDV